MANDEAFTPPAVGPFDRNIVGGKVALITGGSSGIGYEIARQLGLHGAQLVIMERRLQVVETAADTLRNDGVEISQGEVRSEEDAVKAVNTTLSKFGRLDILVNAAAGNFLVPTENLSTKGFRTVLDIDTVGTFNMSRAAFESLKKAGKSWPLGSQGGGPIINISNPALWSHLAAIDSLTRSLGVEWGHDHGIRVNGIAPGPIANTAGFHKLGPADSEGITFRDIKNAVPLGRLGTTWDIAMATLFLASSAGNWITGETIVVDGGSWMSRPRALSREDILQVSRKVEKKSRDIGVAGHITSRL